MGPEGQSPLAEIEFEHLYDHLECMKCSNQMLTEITHLTLFKVAISTIKRKHIHVFYFLSLYGEFFTHQNWEIKCLGEIISWGKKKKISLINMP